MKSYADRIVHFYTQNRIRLVYVQNVKRVGHKNVKQEGGAW